MESVPTYAMACFMNCCEIITYFTGAEIKVILTVNVSAAPSQIYIFICIQEKKKLKRK